MTRFHRYPVFRLVSAVSFLLLSTGGVSFAQELESRAKEQRDQQEEKADSPLTFLPSWIKERLPNGVKGDGAPHGFAPAFGDIKRGSGFAPGVAYGYELPTGGVIVPRSSAISSTRPSARVTASKSSRPGPRRQLPLRAVRCLALTAQ